MEVGRGVGACRQRGLANRSLSAVEPVRGTRKRKLEISSRDGRSNQLTTAGTRRNCGLETLAHLATCRNVDDFPTRGNNAFEPGNGEPSRFLPSGYSGDMGRIRSHEPFELAVVAFSANSTSQLRVVLADYDVDRSRRPLLGRQ